MNTALWTGARLAGVLLVGLGWMPMALAQEVAPDVAASAVAPAASMPASSPMLGAQPAPFIAISVADLDAQVAWYTRTLGFELGSQGSIPGRSIRYALLRQGAMLIELLQIPEARPLSVAARDASDASRIHGFFKAGMVVDDVDGLYERLKAQGVIFAIELGHPPGGPYRVFGLRDPEGNLLQFFGV